MQSWRIKSLLLTGVIIGIAAISAAPVTAAEYPQVANLRPFSPEANFMSLPGYLRFLAYNQDGVWLEREEAERIVSQQPGPYAMRPYDPTSIAGQAGSEEEMNKPAEETTPEAKQESTGETTMEQPKAEAGQTEQTQVPNQTAQPAAQY